MAQETYNLGQLKEPGKDNHFQTHSKHIANIADHEVRIVDHEDRIADNETQLADHEGRITDHADRLTELEGATGGPGLDYSAQITLPWAATVETDASVSRNHALTLEGATTLANPTNLIAGMNLTWRIKQDATGGRTLALGSLFKFSYGIIPGASPAANARDLLTAYYDGEVLMSTYLPDAR